MWVAPPLSVHLELQVPGAMASAPFLSAKTWSHDIHDDQVLKTCLRCLRAHLHLHGVVHRCFRGGQSGAVKSFLHADLPEVTGCQGPAVESSPKLTANSFGQISSRNPRFGSCFACRPPPAGHRSALGCSVPSSRRPKAASESCCGEAAGFTLATVGSVTCFMGPATSFG